MSRTRIRKPVVAAAFAAALCACGGAGLWLTGGTASAVASHTAAVGEASASRAPSTAGAAATSTATAAQRSTGAAQASNTEATAAAAPSSGRPTAPGTNAPGSGTLKVPANVQGAWLLPAQLPDAGLAQAWSVSSPARAKTLAEDVWVPMCPGVQGEVSWLVEDYSAGAAQASQQTLLFASATQARQAYRQMTADLAVCQALSRRMETAQGAPATAVVSETYRNPDGSASSWRRTWDGVSTPISTPGAQTDLEYLTQSGAALSVLDLTLPGAGAPAPSAAETAALLGALTNAVGGYAGGVH